ncbi:MAG: hypothetical protein AAF589_07570 [Planctomycetota bacterium]
MLIHPGLSLSAIIAFLACAPLEAADAVPKVALSEQHRAMCKVGVGDQLPTMPLKTPNGDEQALAPLLGEKATVVVFYRSLGWMTKALLADLGPDVVDRFGEAGVNAVAIASQTKPQPVDAYYTLVDADGEALAAVGEGKLPRVYLVGPKSKVLWFDIEYSNSTRRELRQALIAILGGEKGPEPVGDDK